MYTVYAQIEYQPDDREREPVNVSEDDEVFQCETLEEAQMFIASMQVLGEC